MARTWLLLALTPLLLAGPFPGSSRAERAPSLDFDGNDWVDCGASPALDLQTDMTFEAWVRFDDLGGMMAVLSRDDGQGDEVPKFIWCVVDAGAGNYRAALHVNGPGGELAGDWVYSSTWAIRKGAWYHLALVKEGEAYSFYLDGTFLGADQMSFVPPSIDSPFLIGNAEGFGFPGAIDGVRVWNIARSGNEISSTMHESLSGIESGLVGYWRFAEGSGQVTEDGSGHGHTGRLGSLAGPDSSDPSWSFDGPPALQVRVTIDFDTYPDGSTVPSGRTVGDQWLDQGVVFSLPDGLGAYATGGSCSLSPPNHVHGGESGVPVIAAFVDPETGLPTTTDYCGTAQDLCSAPNEGIAMRAYDVEGNLLASIFNSGGGNFEAFSFPLPIIARVEMNCYLQGIDDFVFNGSEAISGGEIVTIDFDHYPDGTQAPPGLSISDQWSHLGVVFSDFNGNPANAVDSGCSLSLPNHVTGGGTPTVVAAFAQPVTFAGTAQDLCSGAGEGILMRAYDSTGNLLGELESAGGGNFEAFRFEEPIIARLEMDPIGQGIDDFRFIPPHPVSAVRNPQAEWIPEPAKLSRAFPNPFNPSTRIGFELSRRQTVFLGVFDLQGRLVRALLSDQICPQGRHEAVWDGRDASGRQAASGTYFFRLEAGGQVETKRAVLVK